MKNVDICERREKILGAIVEAYVDTAMPVGSRTLSYRFRRAMSPATIRNVMADLEGDGFITHPHTSAGRVPTDKGYRYYVDSLLTPSRLTKDEEAFIREALQKNFDDYESLMHTASKIISTLTNLAGVVTTPRLKRSIFKRIEFIPINPLRILVVLITRSGIVKNTIIEKSEPFTKSELVKIASFLNYELDGICLGDITEYLTRKLLQERDSFYRFLEKAMDILSRPDFLIMEDDMFFEGALSIMDLPEFNDIGRAKLFFKMLEEKKDILNLFYQDMDKDGVKIHIGKENPYKNIQDCAIVTCNYKISDRVLGVVAAIGPTRMEYGKVISTVKYLSDILERVLGRYE